jgi:hypothetical protein
MRCLTPQHIILWFSLSKTQLKFTLHITPLGQRRHPATADAMIALMVRQSWALGFGVWKCCHRPSSTQRESLSKDKKAFQFPVVQRSRGAG